MAEEVGATVTGSTQVFAASVAGLVPAPGVITGSKVLYDNGTWAVIPSSGEANTASNLGGGSGIFASKVGVDLQLKSLVAGAGISLTPTGTEITIANTLSGANTTLSNLSSPTAINQDLNLNAGKNILLSNNTFLNAYKADGITVAPLLRLDATDVCVLGTGSGQTVRINAGILAPTSNGNDLGTAALAWDIYINNVLSDMKFSGTRTIQSIDGTTSAVLTLTTGATTTGASGDLYLRSGSSTSGTPGNVILQPGAVGGVRSDVHVYANAFDATFYNTFQFKLPKTITPGGTTGNQSISKISGTVNFAAGASSITVTNSLVTASSIIFATVRTNDATAIIKNVVPGAGSFVINLNAAATAETSVGFFVVN